jgi:chromate transporter
VNQTTLHQVMHLLWVFGQLSVLGFGGGKGIIPQMHVDVVQNYQWVTNAQFTQFYTIGKLVPGPTTIFAALIGYSAMPQAPVLGAFIATVGMFVPSSMIMVGADIMWEKFKESPWRAIVSHGLAPAIVGLVWASVYSISKGTASGPIPYTITALVVVATLRTKLSAPLLIGISGILGMLLLRQ